MKKNLFIAVSLLFFLWTGNYSFAQSSSSVVVTPITANYSATPPTVTFEVSWLAGTRDADHRAKVWVLVDYRRIQHNAYSGGWLRAGIAALPATNAGTASLEPGNTKGFWLQGPDDGFAFAATVTVPVTVNIPSGYAPQFGWCGVTSDRPPTAVEYPGYYALYGTQSFIIQTHPTNSSQTLTEPTKAYIGCIYSLTDATGCPGEPPAMPEITNFTASTSTICKGQSVTLTATATNAGLYSFDGGVTWGTSASTIVSPAAAATYILKATRTTGACTVTYATPITITVNDLPVPQSLVATPDILCAGEPATLTASADGAASYSLNGSTWTESYQLMDYPTATTTYTLYIKSAAGCTASLPYAAAVTVHPALTPGAITTDSGTTTEGIDPNVTIANTTEASGGYGTITYQWRRSGTSSATFDYNGSTYPINNSTTNYSTPGTYYFTRYVQAGFCNSAWAASSGQYTLTVTLVPPPSAGTNTYSCASQTWSEPVRIAACNQSSFTEDNTNPVCRSYTYNNIVYYYYNWPYVNTYGSTAMCPSPWRVPTASDIDDLITCLGTSKRTNVYFPEKSTWGGARAGHAIGTSMFLVGEMGQYWSQDSYSVSLAHNLEFSSSYVKHILTTMHVGKQVRCVR